MIRQVFDVESYFRVIVYYNVDYDFFDVIEKDLKEAGIPKLMLKELWLMMYYEKAKAVTYSNIEEHICVVLQGLTHLSFSGCITRKIIEDEFTMLMIYLKNNYDMRKGE
jgi:hypothetical protein